MKNKSRFTNKDVQGVASSGSKKISKRMAKITAELDALREAVNPEIIEKVAAQVIASNNKMASENLQNAADNYLSKAVIVNPLDPSSEETMQRSLSVPTAEAIGPVALVDKPYVYGYADSFSGPTQFRMLFPFNSINAHFGHSGKIQCIAQSQIVTQEDILPFVRTFWFKNPCGSNRLFEINTYKKYQSRYQYKLVAELDDYMFEFPEWHPEHEMFTIEEGRALLDNLRNVDEVVVSTENLKQMLMQLGVDTPITVMPNYLPKSYYGTDVRRYRLKDIEKPKILYNGSNYHYGKSDGDFEVMKDFILNNLNRFEFTFMGVGRRENGELTLPSYLQEAAKRGLIKVMPFYAATEYPYALRQLRPDYVIAPLQECAFNAAKSDLRYLEASAVGALFIGQRFKSGSSPYQRNMLTFEDPSEILEILGKTKSKDEFNDHLKIQYENLNTRWLDDTNNLLNIVKIFGSGIDGVQIKPEHPQYDQFKNIVDEDGFLK